jgi:hypothetical protein
MLLPQMAYNMSRLVYRSRSGKEEYRTELSVMQEVVDLRD